MNIRIAVATHKQYPVPADPVYVPVQAGSAVHPDLGYARDDSGENISGKNRGYCELTVLYWAWKNLEADGVGLCHYRRYFGSRKPAGKWDRIMTGVQAQRLLTEYDLILPKRRNYWIETNYSQYAHAHHAKDLDHARTVIQEVCPSYLEAFDRVMSRTWGHRFNMLLARKDILDRYCGWLFDILARLEERIDTDGYSEYDLRVYGFLGERLLDVWLENQELAVKEVPVVHLESQNWPRKIMVFLRRKWNHNRKDAVCIKE